MSTIKFQGRNYDIPWEREAEKLVAKSTPAPHTASGEVIKIRTGTAGNEYVPIDFANLENNWLELLKKAATR